MLAVILISNDSRDSVSMTSNSLIKFCLSMLVDEISRDFSVFLHVFDTFPQSIVMI
jgi:hypothetical protein